MATAKTQEEKEEELTAYALKEEDLGVKKTLGGVEMWSHDLWSREVLRLAKRAGVASSKTYIAVARKGLPAIIRDKIGTSFTDWQDFMTKVHEVPIVEITDYVEKKKRDEERQAKTEREIAELRSALARRVQESPRTALSNQLACTSFAAPPSPSPAPRRYTRPGPGSGNAPPANIRRGIPEAMAQQIDWLRIHIDDYPKKTNDETGVAAYMEQKRDWSIRHPGGWVDYSTPYPLHPATALTCTGECFGCGMNGHSVRDCPVQLGDTSLAIDPKEKIWRQLCYKALGAYRRATVEEV